MGAFWSKEEIHPTPDHGKVKNYFYNFFTGGLNEPEEIIGELPKLKTKDNEAG